ncbi:MAG: hypothetical protein GF397_01400 [Elusimicrobia bacterium]|nr:hypothetical protein [Elusimicrobiota bacterium]
MTGGVYFHDQSGEYRTKADEYRDLSTTAQQDSEAAAYYCGMYETMAWIASEFNQPMLFNEYIGISQEYNDLSVSFKEQSNSFLDEAETKKERSAEYEIYANASYALGGIFLVKGLWDLFSRQNPWNLYVKEDSEQQPVWQISTQMYPGTTKILLARKF